MTKTKSTGGPAFPRPAGASAYDARPNYSNGAQSGMSLRDYFAAKAMQTLVEHWAGSDPKHAADTAKASYAFADAMLEERSKV